MRNLFAARAQSALELFAGLALPHSVVLFGLVLLNQGLNVGATTGFALSGRADAPTRILPIESRAARRCVADSAGAFLFWQIVGSVFGLGTQLTFAGLVRLMSLRFANAIGIGLAFVSAQLVSAYLFFKEPFSPAQWLGTAFVFVGILLIALGGK